MPAPVVPGAEPMSVAGSSQGVLVLHGFTGSPFSMRPVAEAAVAAGFTVEMPLLPGHGTDVADMVPTRFSDYVAAVESAYGDLASRCDRVVAAGLSMGGTLACHLGIAHPEIAGLVLVNPMVEPLADSFVEMMRSTLEGGMETIPGIGNDIALEGITERSYPETPLAAALSLFAAVADQAPHLGEISCPVLLYSSVHDHVVPPSNGDFLASTLSGPLERIMLDRSFHVATLDYDGPDIARGAVQFAAKVCG